MIKNILTILILVSAMALTSCGEDMGTATIKCYTGNGEVFYSGTAEGRVRVGYHYGFIFIDKADGLLKAVSGNCLVNYKGAKQ